MARSVRSGRLITLDSSPDEVDEIEQLGELEAERPAGSTSPLGAASQSTHPRSTAVYSERQVARTRDETIPPTSPIVISSRSPSARSSVGQSSPTSTSPITRKRKRGPGRPLQDQSSSSEDYLPRGSRARLAPRRAASDGDSEDETDGDWGNEWVHGDHANDAKSSRPSRSSRSFSRWSLQPMVEVPLLPLAQLRQYSLLPGSSGPSRFSGRRLVDSGLNLDFESDDVMQLGSDDSEDYHVEATRDGARQRARRKEKLTALVAERKGPRWRVGRSPLKGMHPDGESEEGESELYTDAGDEDVGTSELEGSDGEDEYEDSFFERRSKRYGVRNRQKSRRSDRPLRRSTRRSFSPEKLVRQPRSRRRSTSTSEDEDMRVGTRRSRKIYGSGIEEGESEMDSTTPDHANAQSDEDDDHEVDELEDESMSDEDDEKPRSHHDEDLTLRHRAFCEKCAREPAEQMLANFRRKKNNGAGRKKEQHQEDEMPDDERAAELQGWLKCKMCCITSHWHCLSPQQQKDVRWALMDIEGPPAPGERKRTSVRIDETFEFTCARCAAGGKCMVCNEGPRVIESADEIRVKENARADGQGDVEMKDEDLRKEAEQRYKPFFRCYRCKQACHYEHLRDPFGDGESHDLNDIAEVYQKPFTRNDPWLCHSCREWIWTVDIICAWRPHPATAQEPKLPRGEKLDPKADLPREYLVKWKNRGFRHATWVPHNWLKVTTMQKLRNFLEKGPQLTLITDETLAARGDDMAHPTIANIHEAESSESVRDRDAADSGGPPADVNAEASIPEEWRTVDRVLDLCLVAPRKDKSKAGKSGRHLKRMMSASGSPSTSGKSTPAPLHNHPDGLMPPDADRVDIDEWERKTGRILTEEDTDEVARMATWCFVKWDDLQYDQSCWDTPPPATSTLYPAFKRALNRYLLARQVTVPVLTPVQVRQREEMVKTIRRPPLEQPDCVVGGKLMDFQLEGFQWLLTKHFQRGSCILADDMGLGKTIQIASVLGYLGSDKLKIYPLLVVVPNSTITNWVREFEKWVPHMRVVPYYGEKASREVINKYELYHKGAQGKAEAMKAHVLLTTYDMITGSEFRVFKRIPRWEMIVIDEGQRLKSDSNSIFNRLRSLNSVHKVLLTGTPLNNNLRELFNLLNFLDADAFSDLEDLEARFENLSETLVQELHEMIQPYILRRIKADVLRLPPKVEIIVPISLAPLQKNIYKTILERNADVLKAIAENKAKKARKATTNISGGGELVPAGKTAKKGIEAAMQGRTEGPMAQGDRAALAAITAAAAGSSSQAMAAATTDGEAHEGADGAQIAGEQAVNGTRPSEHADEIAPSANEPGQDASKAPAGGGAGREGGLSE